MLEVNGIIYYIDLEELDKRMVGLLDTKEDNLIIAEIDEKETFTEDGKSIKEVSTKRMLGGSESKFKTSVVIDECLRIVLTYRELLGDTEEHDDTKEPTSYKLAFNTLLYNKIIKEFKIN